MFSLTVLISYFLIYFFVPRKGYTKDGKECLVYRSTVDPAVGYEFCRRLRNGAVRKTADGEVYICSGCVAAQKRMRNEGVENRPTVRQITFGANGAFTTDPEQHFHFCEPISWVELQRRQIYRSVVKNVRGKDFSSSQCLRMLNESIANQRFNPNERRQFNRSMPTTRSLKRMLRRAAAPDYPADFGIDRIPDELKNSPFEGDGLIAHFEEDGDEAVNQATAIPLPVIPPIRPQLQNQHLIIPNLLQNPFNEVQQQQYFMNPQIQMLMLHQQQQQQLAHQQQIAQFQYQQMMAYNRFRFP